MSETDTTFETLKAALADRYDVERKLGAGGMAAVYLAKDIKHDREVAIKVLHPELAATIGADRFEREIKMAAKLQHPNILGMYDSGSADGLLFYVMPFVQGESLRDKLDRETQLGVDEAIQITLEVASALGHAHAKGIIHRDIKPENILLQDGHALVADFGIAKAAEEGSNAKLTQTGMALGTPVYMAPEQSVGEKVGPTADLYSLGCMLYEMLAGEPPFTGKNGAMIMAKHALEAVPSIRIIRPNVPEEVEQAIFAAMGKVPADRPKSAAEFTEILGVPMGATATRRAVMRVTATNRIPTGMTSAYAIPADALPPPVPFYKKPPAVIAATVALIGAAIGGYQLFAGGGPGVPEEVAGLPRSNLAVLYFQDNSSDSSLRYLADGLTEGLIENLTGVQGIKVVSRAGSEQVRGSSLDVDSIARILGAGTLIAGDVSPDRSGVRVNVRLVDGVGGADIPDSRRGFTLPDADLVKVRDSLAAEVALLVRERVGREIALAASQAETKSSAAWSLVQRAEQLRKRGEEAPDRETLEREFQAADSLLAEAERQDSKWIRPIIERASLDYWRAYTGQRDPAVQKPLIDEGLRELERAFALDRTNPDALELRGNLRYWGVLMRIDPANADSNLVRAQTDLEQATDRNPGQAGAWASLSHLYNYTKTQVDIGMAARRAMEADAFLRDADRIIDRLFLAYYDQNQPTEADAQCRESRRRFADRFYWPRCELYMLTTRNRPADITQAWSMADTMVALTPEGRREGNRLRAHMLVAAVIARAADSASKTGQADRAKLLADSARAVAGRSIGDAEIDGPRELAYGAAFVYTLLGDVDRAVANLQLYFAANEGRRESFAQDPGWWFRPIANDPKFRRLVGSP